MKIQRVTFILILLIIAAANFSVAQIDNNNKRQTKNGIDSIMRQKVMENLNLDESTTEKFMNAYKSNVKELRNLNKQRKEKIDDIEADPGAADIDSKLDGILDIEYKMVDQRKSFLTELKTFLTSRQIAESIVLKKNLEKEFRKEIMKHRRQQRKNDDSNDNELYK